MNMEQQKARHLKAAILNLPNWYREDELKPNAKIGRRPSPLVGLINYLSKALNFSYEYLKRRSGESGVRLDNGTWTGTTGMMQSRIADIILGPYSPSAERSEVVAFSTPVYLDQLVFLTSTRMEDGHLPFYFFHALDTSTWIAFLIMALVAAIVVSQWGNQGFSRSRIIIAMDAYLCLLCSCLGSNKYEYFVRRWSCLILYITWSLSTLVLMRIFASELTSMMSIDLPPRQIESIVEIVEDKEILPMTAVGSISHTLVKESPRDSLFNRLLKKMERHGGLVAFHEILSEDSFTRCARGEVAIILPTYEINYMTHLLYSKNPSLYENTFRFPEQRFQSILPILLGFPKTMSRQLQDSFNYHIILYASTGIYEDSIRNAFSNAARCFHSDDLFSVGVEANPLTINEMRGAVFCHLIGSSLTCLGWLLGLTIMRLKKCSSRQLLVRMVRCSTIKLTF